MMKLDFKNFHWQRALSISYEILFVISVVVNSYVFSAKKDRLGQKTKARLYNPWFIFPSKLYQIFPYDDLITIKTQTLFSTN